MKKTIIAIIVIVILAVIGLVVYFNVSNNVDISVLPTDKSNLIIVASPIKDSKVSSPLTVSGRARGTWFFEGSFPIFLTDWDGKIIAEGHASAQGDWMTDEFVKFVGNLQFDKPAYGERGTLIFKKDNPSGLPEHDDAYEITVLFK